ncbi:kinase-like domain-containing protein [Hyaloraphidium curvatum]|nr:kinase-like domain-containing protein [Hyaloraphidium curvatum]
MNHLHSRPMPILHSDLKGANVLVDENGVAKVADFGLSKIRSGSTRQTMFVGGTPSYMAPEGGHHAAVPSYRDSQRRF